MLPRPPSHLLSDLHPTFMETATEILRQTAERIAPSTLHASSTFRTLAEQAALKKSGATTLSVSFHNYGFAMDVAVLTPEGVYVTKGDDPRYRTFGEVAESLGCVWGGRWTSPDPAHTELCGGISIAEYLQWLKAHALIPVPAVHARKPPKRRRSGLKGE